MKSRQIRQLSKVLVFLIFSLLLTAQNLLLGNSNNNLTPFFLIDPILLLTCPVIFEFYHFLHFFSFPEFFFWGGRGRNCNFIEKEALIQVFSCEFREINNTFLYRTPLVAVSEWSNILHFMTFTSQR